MLDEKLLKRLLYKACAISFVFDTAPNDDKFRHLDSINDIVDKEQEFDIITHRHPRIEYRDDAPIYLYHRVNYNYLKFAKIQNDNITIYKPRRKK